MEIVIDYETAIDLLATKWVAYGRQSATNMAPELIDAALGNKLTDKDEAVVSG